jgi:threonine 3-dehydrogenase
MRKCEVIFARTLSPGKEKRMSTLVTGGTGFIGAQVVRFLLEKGTEDLVVFDINPSTTLLDDVSDQVEVVRGDLGNFSHVLDVVKASRPKVIYHLGGMLSAPSDADPPASLRANAMGTFHVLEAARLFDVPQVLFSSTLGTYGLDNRAEIIDDYTLQRPLLFYGATKVFCEHMGLFYKRKYGLDFRGIRYPSIVGPGVRTPGIVQYTSWVIEESIKGNPFAIWVKPETKCPVIYFKDAALAIIRLAEAPIANIKMVNYLIAGATPVLSAQELADIVKIRIPTAEIEFKPNPEIQRLMGKGMLQIDDSIARKEWGWKSEYDQERMVDDFIHEMEAHPQRYV